MTDQFDGCDVTTFNAPVLRDAHTSAYIQSVLIETATELKRLELLIAERHSISGEITDIRKSIIERLRSGTLVEDELVAEWNFTYSCYLDFLEADMSTAPSLAHAPLSLGVVSSVLESKDAHLVSANVHESLIETAKELERLEFLIAERHSISGDVTTGVVHRAIIERLRSGTLVEDELVADWNCAYSRYLYFLEADPKYRKPAMQQATDTGEELLGDYVYADGTRMTIHRGSLGTTNLADHGPIEAEGLIIRFYEQLATDWKSKEVNSVFRTPAEIGVLAVHIGHALKLMRPDTVATLRSVVRILDAEIDRLL
jgi:hypothetical protein